MRGALAYIDGEVVAEPGIGRFVERASLAAPGGGRR